MENAWCPVIGTIMFKMKKSMVLCCLSTADAHLFVRRLKNRCFHLTLYKCIIYQFKNRNHYRLRQVEIQFRLFFSFSTKPSMYKNAGAGIL